MCADACEAASLEVPGLGEETEAQSAPAATAGGLGLRPVDMIATDCRSVPGHDPRPRRVGRVDALIGVIFVRPLLTTAEDAARRSASYLELPRELPLLAVFMSARDAPR